MYNILIADDEGITVDALKYIIEKNFPGQCNIECAKTGREGIMLAETMRPDIAFMDIHMPGINGIDAIKEIRKSQPTLQIIIISAYDKFSYAKTAIELSVLKYINKPFEQKQIVEVLECAMNNIKEERNKRNEDLLIREKLENIIPIIQNGFINDLLFKEQFDEDIDTFKKLLEINTENGCMLSIVFGEKKEGNHMTNASGASVFLQNNIRTIRALIEGTFANSIIGNSMANKIAVFIPYEHSSMDYSARSELVNKALAFVHSFTTKYDMQVRIGIGLVKEINRMSESYQEAALALVQSTRTVAHADDVSVTTEYEKNYPIELERDFFDVVKKGATSESRIYAGQFYDWLLTESGGSEMDIRLKVIEFVLWVEHIAFKQAGLSYVFKARSNYLEAVNMLSVDSELKDWFLDRVVQATDKIANMKKEKSTSIIDKALKYINENYTNDISLDDISMKIDVTPYYFSRIFKEEMGVNFIEYVTDLRINKAKELLADDSYSMKEICKLVGYSDPNYFSRTFRKHEGVSPSEYREGIKQ